MPKPQQSEMVRTEVAAVAGDVGEPGSVVADSDAAGRVAVPPTAAASSARQSAWADDTWNGDPEAATPEQQIGGAEDAQAVRQEVASPADLPDAATPASTNKQGAPATPWPAER
eukprot:15435859-Alexandrium_andersonii.AAC.1